MPSSFRVAIYSVAIAAAFAVQSETFYAELINHNLVASFSDGSSLTGMIAGDTGADLILTEDELTSWMMAYSGSPTLNPFVLDSTTDFTGNLSWDTTRAFIDGEMAFASNTDIASIGLVGSIRWVIQDGTGAFELSSTVLGGPPALLTPKPSSVVPEPSTLTLLGIGAFGMAFYGWRLNRKKRRAA